MIKSIQELKRQLNARVLEDSVERDDEGRAVISMSVLNDDDFLSDFSAGATPTISSEVSEFLEESATAFLPKEQLHIKIYSDCIDSEEEKLYKNALTEYYVRHYKRNWLEMRRNLLISVVMLLIGIAALSGGVTFTWVFIWEAVDLFFLERSVLRREKYRCLSFIAAKVSYFPRVQEPVNKLAEEVKND